MAAGAQALVGRRSTHRAGGKDGPNVGEGEDDGLTLQVARGELEEAKFVRLRVAKAVVMVTGACGRCVRVAHGRSG